eukprot:9531910-Ditylum_brightwellii.AAC.1
MQSKYGKEKLMTVTRKTKHDYLCIKIDFTNPGKVIIDMTKYVDKMLLELPPKFDSKAATPAANHLFMVNEDTEKLDKDWAQLAHHSIAKSKKTNMDDWKKLIRTMRYLLGMGGVPLMLEANNLNQM